MDILNYQDSGYNLFTYNNTNTKNTSTNKRPHSLHSPYHLNFDSHHDFEYIVPQTTTTSSTPQQPVVPPHYMDRYTKPLGSLTQLPMGKSFSNDYNSRLAGILIFFWLSINARVFWCYKRSNGGCRHKLTIRWVINFPYKDIRVTNLHSIAVR